MYQDYPFFYWGCSSCPRLRAISQITVVSHGITASFGFLCVMSVRCEGPAVSGYGRVDGVSAGRSRVVFCVPMFWIAAVRTTQPKHH